MLFTPAIVAHVAGDIDDFANNCLAINLQLFTAMPSVYILRGMLPLAGFYPLHFSLLRLVLLISVRRQQRNAGERNAHSKQQYGQFFHYTLL